MAESRQPRACEHDSHVRACVHDLVHSGEIADDYSLCRNCQEEELLRDALQPTSARAKDLPAILFEGRDSGKSIHIYRLPKGFDPMCKFELRSRGESIFAGRLSEFIDPAQRALTDQLIERRERLEAIWKDQKEEAERKAIALDLLRLDQIAWETLCTARAEFEQAVESEDVEAQVRLAEIVAEMVFQADQGRIDEQWMDGATASAPTEVVERVERERTEFFERYFSAKDASGLRTQKQVAEAAGISPTTVQGIEARRVKPHFKTVQKLAQAFGVAVEELLGGSEGSDKAGG